MRLFSADLVPVMLGAWSGATEKAPKHDETKVVKVTLLVQLTTALASAFVPGDGEVKAVSFKAATDGSVRPFLRVASFNIPMKKQRLEVFATPDSPAASIAFDHVRMMKTVGLRVDVTTPVLVLRATVGPCGPQEYAALGAWHRSQRFVTFHEADASLEFDGAGVEASAADMAARQTVVPMRREEPAAASADSQADAGHRYPKRSRRSARTAH